MRRFHGHGLEARQATDGVHDGFRTRQPALPRVTASLGEIHADGARLSWREEGGGLGSGEELEQVGGFGFVVGLVYPGEVEVDDDVLEMGRVGEMGSAGEVCFGELEAKHAVLVEHGLRFLVNGFDHSKKVKAIRPTLHDGRIICSSTGGTHPKWVAVL